MQSNHAVMHGQYDCVLTQLNRPSQPETMRADAAANELVNNTNWAIHCLLPCSSICLCIVNALLLGMQSRAKELTLVTIAV